MTTLTDQDLQTTLDASPKAIVMFSASWCGPCKAFKPKFQKLAEETTGVDFFYCDVDSAQRAAMDLSIQSVPTIVSFRDGDDVRKVIGADESGVRGLIEELLKG
jgi:thioredoxin-like negative regulator of GroEL